MRVPSADRRRQTAYPAVGEREGFPEQPAGRHRNVRSAVAPGAQLKGLKGTLEPAALGQPRLRGFDLGAGEGPQRPADELGNVGPPARGPASGSGEQPVGRVADEVDGAPRRLDQPLEPRIAIIARRRADQPDDAIPLRRIRPVGPALPPRHASLRDAEHLGDRALLDHVQPPESPEREADRELGYHMGLGGATGGRGQGRAGRRWGNMCAPLVTVGRRKRTAGLRRLWRALREF